MSAQPNRSDDDNIPDRSYRTSSNARTAAAAANTDADAATTASNNNTNDEKDNQTGNRDKHDSKQQYKIPLPHESGRKPSISHDEAQSTLQPHQSQHSTNFQHSNDNQLDVEAASRSIRRRSIVSVASGANRRSSRLSFNYSQGRSSQPHQHRHAHHQVPPPKNNFSPFTRESLEAIKQRISEENARKLQQQQAQHDVCIQESFF